MHLDDLTQKIAEINIKLINLTFWSLYEQGA